MDSPNNIKLFNLIYCSVCKSIPEIKLVQKEKEILFSKKCKCQPESEKLINDLIKNIIYQEKKKICEKDINHGIAEIFCTECLKWYCSKCSTEHDDLNHITIESKEKIEINLLCKNENCSYKGKIEFYCQSCLKSICIKCKDEHDKNHELITYEDFFKDENIIQFKNDVKEVSNYLNEKNKEYAKIIGEIENIVKNLKELFEKKVERNTNLLKLYEAMINTYEITNKINNYQIRKNILNAYSVKDIFKVDENYIRNSILSEFKNINKKIEDFTDENSLNEICYFNLFHCDDYIKIDSIDTKNLEFTINCICPKNSHKFENKNLSEFINENNRNNNNLNYVKYLCDNHNKYYKYFCLKCNVNLCEKCKEHEEHKENLYDLSKEIAQISDIANKKINNKKDLEDIITLQKEYNNWRKEFNSKMTNYFENVKFILGCKDEIFNNLENKKYNYSYVLNCNYIINKIQIEKKFLPQYLPENLPHFIKYGYDVLKFIGFNAEGRPKYLCPSCYEKLGKPQTYTSWCPSSCRRGHNVGSNSLFCFICGKRISYCFSCGGGTYYEVDRIYCLK